jgi:solute carrier family 25 (mitochondrial folate transporter), member 32
MALCTSPVIVVKVRMQTKDLTNQVAMTPKIFPTVKNIMATEGVSGFYRGIVPALLCSPHGAIQWVIYESFKSKYAQYVGNDKATVSGLIIKSSRVI